MEKKIIRNMIIFHILFTEQDYSKHLKKHVLDILFQTLILQRLSTQIFSMKEKLLIQLARPSFFQLNVGIKEIFNRTHWLSNSSIATERGPLGFGPIQFLMEGTWRIIPVSKWLGSPPFISHKKAVCKGSHNPS